ncbi:ABC transporter permease [bacterium]|nr:ABC transporter permease [bacterium]
MDNNLTQNETVIKPGWLDKQYWIDIWNYRELFYFLALRDIKVRYKQTVIGIAWVIIQPLLSMVIFSVIFGKIANLPSETGVPYPIMVYAALLPWQFFSQSLSAASNSVVGNVSLISKIYMPRLIIPASKVVVGFVDFLVSFVILLVLMLFYRFTPSARIFLLPVFLFIAFVAAYGFSLFFAALNVKYRDFRHAIPFVVQLGLYISPVGFSSSVIAKKWPHLRFIYSLNPMVGVIDGFRWAILGGEVKLYMPGFIASIILIGAMFVGGLFYFRKTEKTFADFI